MAGEQTVRDYVTLIRGTTYKGILVGKPGPALLGLGSIYPGGGFREGDYKTYGGDCPPKLMLTPGDLFVSLKGATKDGKMIGSVARVPASVPSGRLTQDTVKLEFRSAERAKASSYLYWLLRTPQYRAYCDGRAMGSAVVALSRDDFLDYPVPSFSCTRKSIVEVLERIEDKIELNRRMNATLETTARALFQSWFVDFEPVRAKLDGRSPPGLDSATAALFPDSFQDSPIGHVPTGWKVDRFDTHIAADRGLSYKGEGLRDDRAGLPMHNLNSIYEGGGYKHEGLKYYAGEYREKHLLDSGDMIVTNTEQGFDHLLIGHAAIVPRCYGPKGLFSHHIYRVRHKPNSPFSPHYLVELFNNRRWHYWISGFSNGTTINMLPKDALEMPLLVVPPVELVKKFTALAEAAHIQVEENKEQSRTLATLRNTLLPKLLSGELRVKSAEREIAR
ncbi:restriction endonuclease subunit S [Dokdonella immobilis]|uniref:Restriction endonuclease S subunit n=1 Tax=Dokdonella immobilis TaxID=578942 RepID=A0A1I4ZUZ8_9GAMM|nr:restriction endonuclease subunit S [Dokdonella immobilis]SFN54096.1 Restriction endonuclease S subunit [Dokdonella immobilis]